jgi:hypothetical protein
VKVLITKHVPDFNNDIFLDFSEWLKHMEASQKEWENKPVNSWEGADWQGFFMYLEQEIELTNWNYVNNQTGGFWCAVLNWDYCFGMPIYAQIEGQRICVKLALEDPLKPNPFSTDPKDLRNKVSDIFRARANAKGLNMFRKPNRFGFGKTMTLVEIQATDWLGSPDAPIDKLAVSQKLIQYRDFVISTVKELEITALSQY